MTYQNKEDRCFLNHNRRRTKEGQPHLTGAVVLSKDTLGSLFNLSRSGQEAKLWISCWINDRPDGSQSYSISVKPPMAAQNPAPAAPVQQPGIRPAPRTQATHTGSFTRQTVTAARTDPDPDDSVPF